MLYANLKTGCRKGSSTIIPGLLQQVVFGPKDQPQVEAHLDLSQLKSFLAPATFKMETPETIRLSLQQGEWVTSLDFSNAYFHISISQTFQFNALPFDLLTAPLEFTKVVKEVKLMAQARGIRIHQYLDDWLLRDPCREICLQHTQILLGLCHELGWIVNLPKLVLTAQQVFNFVGYHFDLSQGLVNPSQERWLALIQKIETPLGKETCSVKQFMSLIGLLTDKEWHLKKHWHVPEVLEKLVPLPKYLHVSLRWWLNKHNVLRSQPLYRLSHAFQLFTDTSNEGWRALLGYYMAKKLNFPIFTMVHTFILHIIRDYVSFLLGISEKT